MDIKTQSGIERLRAMIAGAHTAAFADLLNFHPVEAEPGRIVFEGAPGEKHFNPNGIVHGGYAASVLDSAMGCAVESLLEAGFYSTTIELKINYVRAMNADTGTVRAIATSLHPGRTIATAEGRLTDGDGRLLAHGTTTCMILSR